MKPIRFLAALSFAWFGVSIPAQTITPSLDGVVIDMGSNTPLHNATLELRGVSDSTRRYVAVSSAMGQFVFRGPVDDLAAGKRRQHTCKPAEALTSAKNLTSVRLARSPFPRFRCGNDCSRGLLRFAIDGGFAQL